MRHILDFLAFSDDEDEEDTLHAYCGWTTLQGTPEALETIDLDELEEEGMEQTLTNPGSDVCQLCVDGARFEWLRV